LRKPKCGKVKDIKPEQIAFDTHFTLERTMVTVAVIARGAYARLLYYPSGRSPGPLAGTPLVERCSERGVFRNTAR
jgi:hypothetical protein